MHSLRPACACQEEPDLQGDQSLWFSLFLDSLSIGPHDPWEERLSPLYVLRRERLVQGHFGNALGKRNGSSLCGRGRQGKTSPRSLDAVDSGGPGRENSSSSYWGSASLQRGRSEGSTTCTFPLDSEAATPATQVSPGLGKDPPLPLSHPQPLASWLLEGRRRCPRRPSGKRCQIPRVKGTIACGAAPSVLGDGGRRGTLTVLAARTANGQRSWNVTDDTRGHRTEPGCSCHRGPPPPRGHAPSRPTCRMSNIWTMDEGGWGCASSSKSSSFTFSSTRSRKPSREIWRMVSSWPWRDRRGSGGR